MRQMHRRHVAAATEKIKFELLDEYFSRHARAAAPIGRHQRHAFDAYFASHRCLFWPRPRAIACTAYGFGLSPFPRTARYALRQDNTKRHFPRHAPSARAAFGPLSPSAADAPHQPRTRFDSARFCQPAQYRYQPILSAPHREAAVGRAIVKSRATLIRQCSILRDMISYTAAARLQRPLPTLRPAAPSRVSRWRHIWRRAQLRLPCAYASARVP